MYCLLYLFKPLLLIHDSETIIIICGLFTIVVFYDASYLEMRQAHRSPTLYLRIRDEGRLTHS